ncbi:MAG: acyltransferase, partial [Burkholderiales bacterium]|nr:acyltransferase [Burkholderiales bacterium]
MSFVQNLTSRFYLSCDPSNPHQKNYRPHIDGLRAIAVLSVVGYHFFPNWVKGGFVGVDIFFVISGFLIGGILLDSLYNHSFSIKDFYARRVKRIFPALIVVLAATLAFGGFALLPEDFKNLGKHTVGGAGFIANLMFWKESGYFDVASEKKELLHLWSLGVEEQFYIIFPLLLWGLTKKNLRLVTFIVLLFVASFYWNLAVYKKDPAFDFYSPVTRFWELLAGVLLALWERRHREGSLFFRCQPAINTISSLARQIVFNPTSPPNNRAGALSSFVSLAGIVFIVIALYKAKAAGFPGKQALYPVLGAVCLIGAGSHALGNRLLLSLKPMVWIGLISYPLYLWHWPLITYARVIVNGVPSRTLRISLLLVAILLATLTYGFIEKPIRF